MQFPVGIVQYPFERENGKRVPVVWDVRSVVNAHLMFAGKSGAGKSTLLRRAISQAAASSQGRVRFHVFDKHGDLGTPGESVVRFSESTPYGCINPLEVNPDPHFGGVRRSINKFLVGVNRSHKLGARQVAAMRRLLGELYLSRGYTKEPHTWIPQDPTEIAEKMLGKEDRMFIDVSYSQRDAAKAVGARWDGDLKSWWLPIDRYEGDALIWQPKVLFKTPPTLEDAVSFAYRKLQAVYLGANAAVMTHALDVNRQAAKYHRLAVESNKETRGAELEAIAKKRENARDKAIEAFTAYLDSVQTGRELEDLLDYRGLDVMSSIYDRLVNINDYGIFRSEPPPFDPLCGVWRRDISAMADEEADLFVHFSLSRLVDEAFQRGEQDHVCDIAVLDESDTYFNDEEDNMPNKIAKQTRKFGLNLWAVSQSVSNFSDAFLENIGAKIIFFLDQTTHDKSARKLGIDKKELEHLRPRYNALVQIENINDGRSTYRRVICSEK
ncbi:DUF5710 domain-containing protein [Trinickia mobilis]|uniref:DUF5710 domain-containing protein n=1 Tax=Trinickia mobilis TaxID=2816356 RepID=UPI001A8DF2E4|nr:DUF5710 domain-containing protein [Trinickia mobilis]